MEPTILTPKHEEPLLVIPVKDLERLLGDRGEAARVFSQAVESLNAEHAKTVRSVVTAAAVMVASSMVTLVFLVAYAKGS